MNNMNELEEILISHYKKYPCMQIQDAVKLIYQNEFAGGHLISNEAESLARLREEIVTGGQTQCHGDHGQGTCPLAQSVRPSCGEPLFEEIGNGLCRLNLRGLADRTVSLETVNRFFIYTSETIKGTIRVFEKKLGILLDCCDKGTLTFKRDEAEEYVSAYKKQGYPPVSHSAIYREMYHPAYRIVLSDFCRYFDIFCRIDELLKRAESSQYAKDHITVAVDGGSCSGKSTLAALLHKIYDCNLFHMDDFFLTPELRTEERLRETGGNVDYVRFKDEVINGIQSRRSFEYRIYDCSAKTMQQAVSVTPKKLNIVEGAYSMHPTLSDYYDLKIFLNIEADEQSRRILKRNGPVMHKRFMEEWVPKENAYFKKFDVASKCDLVF